MKSFIIVITVVSFMLVACSVNPTYVAEIPTSSVPATELPIASRTITPSITPTFENIQTLRAVIQKTRQAEGTSTQIAMNLTLTVMALTPSSTPTATPSPKKTLTGTPTPTIDTTQQTWHETAIAIQKTTNAKWEQARNEKATQVAQFPPTCDETSFPSNVSPDGKWIAANCGRKRDEILVVQNKEGTKWTLNFGDFLHPDAHDEIWGSLKPIFWGLEGKYFYFTTILGYSAGGSQCFAGHGYYGLFRLNLQNGEWIALVPPPDMFDGDAIKFSPTGEHYAITANGVTIYNLKTGKVTRIDASGIQELSWSPDGNYLAFSVASCGEFYVESSSVFAWEALTDQTKMLFNVDELLLKPKMWLDNSLLRIEGEKIVDYNNFYTIYEYDITQNSVVFSGTATPRP